MAWSNYSWWIMRGEKRGEARFGRRIGIGSCQIHSVVCNR